MHVYFSLGTNLGNKEQNLRLAVQYIEKRIGKVISPVRFLCYCSVGGSPRTMLS